MHGPVFYRVDQRIDELKRRLRSSTPVPDAEVTIVLHCVDIEGYQLPAQRLKLWPSDEEDFSGDIGAEAICQALDTFVQTHFQGSMVRDDIFSYPAMVVDLDLEVIEPKEQTKNDNLDEIAEDRSSRRDKAYRTRYSNASRQRSKRSPGKAAQPGGVRQRRNKRWNW